MTTAVATAPATFYAIQGGNDLGWRVEAPARAIGANVCTMPEVGAWYCLMQPNTDSEFKWVVTDDGADYPEHEGAAIWTRPDLARATHAKAMRDLHGVRTLAEVDDNYLNAAKSKGGYKFNYFMVSNGFDETARLDHMKSCASMDGIILTTEWLRDYYHRAMRQQFGTCPELFVCGNHVELDRWPEATPSEDGRLRIGFMGSPSHIWDVRLAFPALKWAADNGHHVIMVGYDPQWRRFFDYTHVPWTTPDKYRRSALPFDIGVAPLRYDTHTLGKSDIKPIEYGMSDAATVASAHPVYTRSFKHEETVLFGQARWELQWQLERLCKDKGLRESLVENMQGYIRAERNIVKRKGEWLDAIHG